MTMDKDNGFTLVELLITIVVLSIVLAAGVPAFKDFIKNNRVSAQANDLVSAIQLARTEAVKRGTNAVVCASKNQTSCTGKDDWASGWIVFSDLNGNNAPDVGTGKCLATEDCIMTTDKGLSQGSTLTTAAKSLCFLPTGLSGTHLPPSDNCSRENAEGADFTVKVKDCEKTQARKISVTQQGHTSVAAVSCS